MNECSICKKLIPDNATHCSIKCLNEAHVQGIGQVSRARASFVESMGKMLKMEAEPTKAPELATVVVTHNGRRSKGELVGNTFFKFNEAGIARVPLLGYVLEDVESLVKYSRGLATYHVEQPVTVKDVEDKIEVNTKDIVETTEIDQFSFSEEENEIVSSVYVDNNDQPVRKPVRPPKRK